MCRLCVGHVSVEIVLLRQWICDAFYVAVRCCLLPLFISFFLSTLPPFILDCCPQHSLHAGNVRAILDRNDFCIDVILREIAVCSIFSNNMIDVWKMQGIVINCAQHVFSSHSLILHTHTHAKANTVISSLTIDACKSR